MVAMMLSSSSNLQSVIFFRVLASLLIERVAQQLGKPPLASGQPCCSDGKIRLKHQEQERCNHCRPDTRCEHPKRRGIRQMDHRRLPTTSPQADTNNENPKTNSITSLFAPHLETEPPPLARHLEGRGLGALTPAREHRQDVPGVAIPLAPHVVEEEARNLRAQAGRASELKTSTQVGRGGPDTSQPGPREGGELSRLETTTPSVKRRYALYL